MNYLLQSYDIDVKFVISTRPVFRVPASEVVTEKSLVLEVKYMRKCKICNHKWIIYTRASIFKWIEFFLQGQFFKYPLLK